MPATDLERLKEELFSTMTSVVAEIGQHGSAPARFVALRDGMVWLTARLPWDDPGRREDLYTSARLAATAVCADAALLVVPGAIAHDGTGPTVTIDPDGDPQATLALVGVGALPDGLLVYDLVPYGRGDAGGLHVETGQSGAQVRSLVTTSPVFGLLGRPLAVALGLGTSASGPDLELLAATAEALGASGGEVAYGDEVRALLGP